MSQGTEVQVPFTARKIEGLAWNTAMLVSSGTGALAVTDGKNFDQIADHAVAWWAGGQWLSEPIPPRGPFAQDDIVLIVRSIAPSGFGLSLWDQSSRTLVDVTDALFFADPGSGDWPFVTNCSVPFATRSAGPSYYAHESGKYVYFAEVDASSAGSVRLLVMGIDPLTPPRLLKTLPTTECQAPLASRTGNRIGLAIEQTGGKACEVFVGTP